jgi:hypothetical protein
MPIVKGSERILQVDDEEATLTKPILKNELALTIR